MSNFNKTLLGKNIKYLTSKKGIKVGDLENQVDVSIGYFSRLANDDGKNTSTMMDTICKVAEKLEISVNTLISIDLSELTPNETLLSKFFDKLGKDTSENVLIWDLEQKSKLESWKYQRLHPFFCSIDQDQDGFYFHSTFNDNVLITGDAYNVNVNGKLLFLFKVTNKSNTKDGFELYFYFNNGIQDIIEPLCKAYSDSDLYNQIDDLYKVAAESSRHVKLSESVLNSINDYLNPIPF